ncbi:MAG: APC family permease [Kofleriaceae bacterium]
MTAPKRQLGLIVTAAIVVANMIGTGVFTSTGFQAAALHDPLTILLAWVIGGVLALCGAAAYAELGSMMPRAGGEYIYLREAYHPAVGFMSGWVSLIAGFSAPIAVSALAFSKYLSKLVPGLGGEPWILLKPELFGLTVTVAFGAMHAVAITLIVAIAAMHAFDTKLGGRVQTVFTAAKVLLIVVFIVAGFLVGDGDWSNFASRGGGLVENLPTSAFAIALIFVAFSYSGWNAAAYIANEVKQPERTLPRALLLGTGLVMALYVLLNVVFFYALPPEKLAGVFEIGDATGRALFGDRAGSIMTSVIALALVSSVSAMVMAGPRVYAAMATARALPGGLARHNKRGVPMYAVVTQGVIASAFVIIGDPNWLIQMVGFTLSIFAALTVSAVFVLRRRGMTSKYRTSGFPVTPVLFIVLSIWMAGWFIYSQPTSSAVVAGILLVGAGVYAVWIRGKQSLPDESVPDAEAPERPVARVGSDPDD